MPITNTAAFAQYRRIHAAVVTTASTVFDAPTPTVLLAVAGPDGALITRLAATPRATVAATNVQAYLSKDGGTTMSLIASALVAAATLSVSTAIASTALTQIDGTALNESNPLPLSGQNSFGTTAPTWAGLSAGSANAQTLPFATGVTTLAAGIIIYFEAGLTNTTSMTLTVGTAAAASVVRDSSGSAVSAGDITVGFRYGARCDGTFWRLFITDRLYVATSVALASGIIMVAEQADF